MAGPVPSSGTITITIDPGRTLVVTGASGSKGAAAIFNGAATEKVEAIAGTQSREYGPYTTARTCRIYVEAGSIDYRIASTVVALATPGPPVISSDGKTISGTGVKPGTAVPVYNVDTGASLGQTTSLADGTWALVLKTAVPTGMRVGYDPVIVGPYAIAPSAAGALLAKDGSAMLAADNSPLLSAA